MINTLPIFKNGFIGLMTIWNIKIKALVARLYVSSLVNLKDIYSIYLEQ